MIIYRIYIISLFISDMLELIEDKEDIDYAEENIIRQVCSWSLITTELVVEIKPENNSGPYGLNVFRSYEKSGILYY